jgi:NADH-quinone oxidoreductase subunit N
MAGFLSKLMVIMGIVNVGVGAGATSLGELHWVWWLALLMVLNSAVSVFYYLRVAVVMFFEEPEEGREGALPSGWQVRTSIFICVVATIMLGVFGDSVLEMCRTAAESLTTEW